MADNSAIEWTDATWNPLRGCSRVSEGCRHCYAEGIAARFSGPGMPFEGLARFVTRPDGTREARWTGKIALAGDDTLTQPLRWRRPRRIFVNSMSDLFHENVPDEAIDRIFAVMALSPQHTFQVLTKRPERMLDYLTTCPSALRRKAWESGARLFVSESDLKTVSAERYLGAAWPLPNVWLGVSVEDQVTADVRIPYLLNTPAEVRFLSCEPLLGPIDLKGWCTAAWDGDIRHARPAARIRWVIAGGESGPGARPVHPDWIRSLRDQCTATRVPFFFKQWGEWAPGEWHFNLDDVVYFRPDDERLPAVCMTSDPREHWFVEDSLPEGSGAYRFGKHAAGALLDGREHREWPK